MTDRTVLEEALVVLHVSELDDHRKRQVEQTLSAVGIDTDEPFEDFQRLRRYGEKADGLERAPETFPGGGLIIVNGGFNRCLDAIKGGDA